MWRCSTKMLAALARARARLKFKRAMWALVGSDKVVGPWRHMSVLGCQCLQGEVECLSTIFGLFQQPAGDEL
eukprot:15480261-Alexandrium_andersonii.AAC.1